MSSDINNLIDALMCLPGVGTRTAQRMAYNLLLGNRQKGIQLADKLHRAMKEVRHCQSCNDFSSDSICFRCSSTSRNQRQLCIVEMPLDLVAIEQSAEYSGQYFVLMGHLSPLDGIGPEQLAIDTLKKICKEKNFAEVIFALNPSVEGEATMHYIKQLLAGAGIRFSQLARGVPMGGSLEFLDSSTIGRALTKRSILAEEL